MSLVVLLLLLAVQLSTQSSIPSTDPSYLSSLQWTPPQKSGYCQGNYVIPSVLLTGVIAVNANDDGSSNQTYLNNMACQWNLNGPRGYVGVLEFAYFDTECGWDFVFIYDGSTTQSPYTAKLCGNRTAAFGYNDLFVSSSNNFIVQFASDQAVVRKGFLAVFNFVPANSLCQSDRDCNGAGSCLRGQCSCDSTHSGAFCQLSIANYTQFFSRELHSAVYDPTRDIMLVTSGHTLQQFSQLLNDVLIYNFTSKLWTQRQPPIGTMAPAERFCHTTFMMNGTMYLYGGVTNAEDSDMLWKYNIDQNTWNVIQTLGEYPPMFEGAAYVFVNNTGQPMLYVFGGYVPLAQSFELSRMLFVLDLTTFAWKILPNSPFPTWGPTGVYHKATNSLYFTGGYRFAESPIQPTLQYQIDSAMWYNNPSQPYELSMSYAQSFFSPQDSDTMIVWGGYPTTLKPNSDNGIPCFSQQFQLYNVACQTWSYIDVPSDLFVRRKGHSLIVRKNQIVVYGGMNGYLLNDMVILDIPATSSSVQANNDCKAKNWCSNTFYWCSDCTQRPYCLWCGDTCAINPVALVAVSANYSYGCPTAKLALSTCPSVNTIQINQTIPLTLATNESKDFTFACDYPTYDMTISIASPNLPMNVTVLSIRPSSIYTNQSLNPYIYIPATNPSRYSGPYTFRVSFPTVVNSTSSILTTISIFVLVSPSPLFPAITNNNNNNNVGGGGSNGNGNTGGGGGLGSASPPAFDENNILTVSGLCLLLTSLVLYLIQRTRDSIMRRRRGLAAGDGQPLPKMPPTFYRVHMAIPDAIFKEIGAIGGRASVPGIGPSRPRNSSVESPSNTSSHRRLTGRSSRILASARLNVDEVVNSSRAVPLSIEPILNIPEDGGEGTKAVCINKLIVLPGAAALIARGHVPPVAIGSTPCEFIPSISQEPKKPTGIARWFKK